MNNLLNLINSKLINNKNSSLFYIFIFIILIFKVGIYYHPALWNLLEIAKDPFNNVFLNEPNKHYLFNSWLGSYLAYLLNLNTKIGFFLLHLSFSIAFIFLFISFIKSKLPSRYFKKSLIIFFVFPVSTTSFFWVGYDSLTLLLMTIILIYPKYLIFIFLLSIGIGLQHFEIGFFAALSILIFNLSEVLFLKKKIINNYNFKFLFFIFLGLFVGKIILLYIYSGMEINSGRLYWIKNSLPHLLYNFYFNFYNIIWFSLGIGWLVVIKYLFENENYLSLLLSLISLLLILPVVDDQTRVFSVSSYMIITIYIISNLNFLKKINNTEIAIIFLIFILFPYGWVWQGDPRQSMFAYDLAQFINYFFDIFNNPVKSSTIWPFERFR